MKFVAAQWLWALVLVAAGYFWVTIDQRRREKRFSEFASREVWKAIAPEIDFKARTRKARALLLAMAFAILALARPQWGSHEEVLQLTGMDVLFVLDVSNSMETEDIVPSRSQKGKHVIRSIVERLKGDRAGLVAFAGSSYLACPLTTDLEYLLEIVQMMGPRMVVNQGTDLGIALETAANALDRGAEEVGPQTHDMPSRVIVLLSDGEDHEGKYLPMANRIKRAGIKLYVLGLGTEKGGPIPVRDESGNLVGYKKDRRNQPIISSFKSDDLLQLAAAAGGRYWGVTQDEGEVDELLKDMGALNRTEYAERRFLVYEDRFQYPLAIAVLLLFLELGIPARRIRRIAGPAILALGFASSLAHAGPMIKKPAPLDAYVENEKGLKAFEEGRLEDAKKDFGAAQARDPSMPELLYNQGAVHLQQGDADNAIRWFQGAAQGAMARGDQELLGKSLYNLGATLAKKGDTKGAIRAYMGAINSAQKNSDSKLEEDARKNIELLYKEDQQKQQKSGQQQQDPNGKGGKDQQKDNQDQQGQGDQKGKNSQNGDGNDQKDKNQGDGQDKDKDKDKDQPKQYQDPSKDSKGRKRFQSQKLSPEDAERVMSELMNREKQLQQRLKKQSGTPQGNQKDW